MIEVLCQALNKRLASAFAPFLLVLNKLYIALMLE